MDDKNNRLSTLEEIIEFFGDIKKTKEFLITIEDIRNTVNKNKLDLNKDIKYEILEDDSISLQIYKDEYIISKSFEWYIIRNVSSDDNKFIIVNGENSRFGEIISDLVSTSINVSIIKAYFGLNE